MELKLKQYKLLKTKNHFKNINFFFVYSLNTSQNIILKKQEFKKHGIKDCKISISPSQKALKNSIFKNYTALLNNYVDLIILKEKKKEINKIFKNSTLLSVKLNNKLYPNYNAINIKFLNYQKNNLFLLKTLKINIKRNYVLQKFEIM